MTALNDNKRNMLNNLNRQTKNAKLGTQIQNLQIGANFYLEGFDGTNNTGNALVDSCDSLTINTFDDASTFNAILDETYYRKGTASIRLISHNQDVIGDDKAYRIISSADWSQSKYIGFWAFPGRDISAGDVKFYVKDNVAGDQFIDLPAMTAGEYKWVEIDISTLTRTAVIRYGFKRNLAAVLDLNIDTIYRYKDTMLHTLENVPVSEGHTQILTMLQANSGVHSMSRIVEGTDYIVAPDTKRIIFLTDQSTKSCLCAYWY